jgi:hypothetical protein
MSYAKGALSISLCVLLSGCVAVWGAAHKVINADEKGITIQYDPTVTSSIRAQVIARDHCKSMGKLSEPVSSEMPGILLGIIEEVYSCVPQQGGNG